jgi:hypothetical protein
MTWDNYPLGRNVLHVLPAPRPSRTDERQQVRRGISGWSSTAARDGCWIRLSD